jgi:hypothetical protein
MLTPGQLGAAIAMLRWSVDDLAAASGTSRHTIYAFLSRPNANPTMKTLQGWFGALHRAGIVLQDEDEANGPGVRLRKGAVVPAPVTEPPGIPEIKPRRKAVTRKG